MGPQELCGAGKAEGLWPRGEMSGGQGCETQKEPQRPLGMSRTGERGREDVEEEGEGSLP